MKISGVSHCNEQDYQDAADLLKESPGRATLRVFASLFLCLQVFIFAEHFDTGGAMIPVLLLVSSAGIYVLVKPLAQAFRPSTIGREFWDRPVEYELTLESLRTRAQGDSSWTGFTRVRVLKFPSGTWVLSRRKPLFWIPQR